MAPVNPYPVDILTWTFLLYVYSGFTFTHVLPAITVKIVHFLTPKNSFLSRTSYLCTILCLNTKCNCFCILYFQVPGSSRGPDTETTSKGNAQKVRIHL